MIQNEEFHYVEPKHGNEFIDLMWDLGQAINESRYIEIDYLRTKDKAIVHRRHQPVAIMFSEYYFYLTAFIEDEEVRKDFDVINDSFPTIYRIDRIKNMSVLDKRFHSNMSQATAAGIKVGAYIVTQAVDTIEAVEEASFIVSACSEYNISLPLAIDVESAGNGSGRGDKISSSQRTAVINAFAQTVRSCGYSAILYANKDWMNNRIYAGNVGCSVWLAQYNSKCTYTGPFTMWQFTEKARVNGISGNVDMSAWKH